MAIMPRSVSLLVPKDSKYFGFPIFWLRAYLKNMKSCVPEEHVMHTWRTCHAYLKNMSCIPEEYVMHTWRTCHTYLKNMPCIPEEHVMHTWRTCHAYLKNMSCVPEEHVMHTIDIYGFIWTRICFKHLIVQLRR